MNNTAASRRDGGFTLIEVMIVMAIVGILSAVAFPAYTSYIQRGYRVEARTVLLENQQFMERYYAANSRYSANVDGTGNPTLPSRLQKAPINGTTRYNLTVSASATTYTLTAAPVATDKCGSITLTNTGVKGSTGTGLSTAECWK